MTQNSYYGAFNRLINVKVSSLKCAQDNDKFKVSNASAKLDYPVALITTDEIAMAGGVRSVQNKDYYLYNGQYQWSFSPGRFIAPLTLASVGIVTSSGSLDSWDGVTGFFGVRPVINLKSETLITKGDGSSLNPFTVS